MGKIDKYAGCVNASINSGFSKQSMISVCFGIYCPFYFR
uniref:Uncharacterized protein n=1 Tax=Faecalibaculum rodentium TaxID=1702221 RepID=A0A140DVY3_9FIRM|nr:hypothetical protein AALO17_16760 [Faecalibaculum rodentium]